MIVKLTEVYEKNKAATSERSYCLREIFINPEHVVLLREDGLTKKKQTAGLLPEGLNTMQEFTKLHLNIGNIGMDVTVVGSPASIKKKILPKQLIKG